MQTPRVFYSTFQTGSSANQSGGSTSSTAVQGGNTSTATTAQTVSTENGRYSSLFYGVVALAVVFAVSTAAIALYAFRRNPRKTVWLSLPYCGILLSHCHRCIHWFGLGVVAA